MVIETAVLTTKTAKICFAVAEKLKLPGSEARAIVNAWTLRQKAPCRMAPPVRSWRLGDRKVSATSALKPIRPTKSAKPSNGGKLVALPAILIHINAWISNRLLLIFLAPRHPAVPQWT
jgi:hypothetical protein